MGFRILSSLVLTALSVATLVRAQCNPLKSKSKILGFTEPYSIDFTTVKTLPDDWIVADYENITLGSNGAEFTFGKRYDAPYIWTSRYMLFGRVEVNMKVAPGTGIISAAVLMSDDLDEIDYEFSGNNFNYGKGVAQTNYFPKGITGTYDRGVTPDSPDPKLDFHTWSFDWSPDALSWGRDGTTIRTLYAKDCDNFTGGQHQYPQSPSRLHLGLWDAGDADNAAGTIFWSGGWTDLSKVPYTMYVKSVKITPYMPGYAYNYTNLTSSWPGKWQDIKIVNTTVNPGQATSSTASSSTTLPLLEPSKISNTTTSGASMLGTTTTSASATAKATSATTTTFPSFVLQTTAKPTPVQANINSSCNAFYLAQSGDDCDSIPKKCGIAKSDFMNWNPDVGPQCWNLWLNYYQCVGVSIPSNSATSSSSVIASTSGTASISAEAVAAAAASMAAAAATSASSTAVSTTSAIASTAISQGSTLLTISSTSSATATSQASTSLTLSSTTSATASVSTEAASSSTLSTSLITPTSTAAGASSSLSSSVSVLASTSSGAAITGSSSSSYGTAPSVSVANVTASLKPSSISSSSTSPGSPSSTSSALSSSSSNIPSTSSVISSISSSLSSSSAAASTAPAPSSPAVTSTPASSSSSATTASPSSYVPSTPVSSPVVVGTGQCQYNGTYSYVGCYSDPMPMQRSLRGYWEVSGAAASPELCAAFCSKYQWELFGIEFKYQCFCGHKTTGNSFVPESQCYMPCDKDKSKICGGPTALSLYQINGTYGKVDTFPNPATLSCNPSTSSTLKMTTTTKPTTTSSASYRR